MLRSVGEKGEVPGQELAPGLSPARRAKSDVTARLRQLLIHATATALLPTTHRQQMYVIPGKDMSSDLPSKDSLGNGVFKHGLKWQAG